MQKKSKFELKSLLLLSMPLIFSNLINAATNFISMYFMSQINIHALAAGAIITSTYGLIVMVVVSILYSVSIMIGKMQGSGQHQEVGAIVTAGIAITIFFGLLFTVIMFHMTSFFDLLGQPHAISVLAGDYFKGITFGLLPGFIGIVYTQLFIGISRSKTILYLTLISVLINSVFSYLLIFGFSSIPAMGMFGGGLASSCTAWISLAITLSITLFSRDFFPYGLFKRKSWTLRYLPILLKIGIPISIQYSVELLAFAVLTYLMGRLGADALSAQQIALQCSMISIMIVMAISQSSSILVSQAVGQKDVPRTIQIANSGLLLGGLFMLFIGLIYWFYPLILISLYLNVHDPAFDTVINLTKIILSISALTQIFDSVRNITAGLLRGYGDTKSSMWNGIISCWLIGIPAAVLFGFSFQLGALGIRMGILLGIFFGCMNLLYRFYTFNKNELWKPLTYAN